MPVAHLHRTIQDQQSGALLAGAQVTLCTPGTQTPIAAPLFADFALSQSLPNPFISQDGFIDVYLADPVTVLVRTSYGSSVTTADHISVLPSAENLFISPVQIHVANTPGTDFYLRGVDSATVEWANLNDIYSPQTAARIGWFASSSFQIDNVLRDANGAVQFADVVWPDGTTGVYAADIVSADFPGRVDAWHVTWADNETPKTFTQPSLIRDAMGAVLTTPTVVVTNGLP